MLCPILNLNYDPIYYHVSLVCTIWDNCLYIQMTHKPMNINITHKRKRLLYLLCMMPEFAPNISNIAKLSFKKI